MAEKASRPKVTISPKSREVLENICNVLDDESKAVTSAGETFAASVITNLLADARRSLTRVNNYMASVEIAERRKEIKLQRKQNASAAPSAGSTKSA